MNNGTSIIEKISNICIAFKLQTSFNHFRECEYLIFHHLIKKMIKPVYTCVKFKMQNREISGNDFCVFFDN